MGERTRFRSDALHIAQAGRCATALADVLYGLGVTHRALAAALGVTLSTVDSWTRVSDPKLPGAANFAALCAWLDARQPGAGQQVAAAAGRPWSGPPVLGAGAAPPPTGPPLPDAPAPAALPPPAPQLLPTLPPTNLPLALTSFVGRAAELATLRELLPTTRLLTLTGPGGIGKTRLALELATEVRADYAQGVWLVLLDALADPALVVQAVASTLSVPEQPGVPFLSTLIAALQARRLLLVLDNCEHLVAAAAGLAEALLQACPQVRILATSRETLGVAGERIYVVPALAVPDPQHLPPLEHLPQVAAVQLFTARAQAGLAAWQVTAANAPALAQLCTRLDGIPLALELAAARVRTLTVEQIAARLDDRFGLLSGSNRLAVPRQQTLRALLDWSYDLLPAPEQALLRRLSVFAGGWTLDAAEAVGGGAAGSPLVLERLAELVNKSLVVAEAQGPAMRYRLLETIRQYAGEQLMAAGEAPVAQAQHLAWCLALAEEAEPHLRGAAQVVWLDRLEQEHANLRAALTWATIQEPGEAGLRLAGALAWFWYTRGYWSEGHTWLAAVLAAESAGPARPPPVARGKALLGACRLVPQEDSVEIRRLAEEALVLHQAQEDPRGVAEALFYLGHVTLVQNDIARGAALLEQSLTLYRQVGDIWGMATVLFQLGNVAWWQEDHAQAQARYAESLAGHRQSGDRRGQALALNNLGNLALEQAEYGTARAFYDQSLVLCRELGDTWGIAMALAQRGRIACAERDYAAAQVDLQQSLALHRELGAKYFIGFSLSALAETARCIADYPTVRTLLQESLSFISEITDPYYSAELLCNLGYLTLHEDDLRGAAAHFRESLRLRPTTDRPRDAAACLAGLAAVAVAAGHARHAAQLLGALEPLRAHAPGQLLAPADQLDYERTLAATRAALAADQFAADWAAGQVMTLDEAIAAALAEIPED